MNKEFNKISPEAQARIMMRNGCQDGLVEPEISIDKADFLIQMIQEICMDIPDDKDGRDAWAMNKPRIEKLADMAQDYTMAAISVLRVLDKQLKEDTEADYRGGGD